MCLYLLEASHRDIWRTKYRIGIDFGALTNSAVLVSPKMDKILPTHVIPYPHGGIDRVFTESTIPLGDDWATKAGDDSKGRTEYTNNLD